MGLFSDIQDAARREARQAREQEEQAALQQDTQPQPIPTPVSEHLEAQPEQMPPPPVPTPEPLNETAQQAQTVPEQEVPTPTPEPEVPVIEAVSEPEPQKQPAPAAKRMSDAEVVAASTKRIQTEIENITRKNMKECVAEHLAGLCAKDPLFAHKVVQPGKTLVDCFSYINQKAQKFAEQERKDNGITESGIYGCAIPTGLVYQWAEEYFTNPVEKKAERKAPTKAATPAKTNRTPAKPEEPAQPKVPPTPAGTHYEQMTLM